MNTIINDLEVFKKYFSTVRIVDPEFKRVIYSEEVLRSLQDEFKIELCYEFWKTGRICDNCISTRAISENNTFVKFEILDQKIHMITAMPIRVDHRNLALELLKDVTDQNIEYFLYQLDQKDDHRNVEEAIARLNELVVKDSLTNIYNRKFVEERLPAEILLAKQENLPLTLILVDINHLKEINDRYGQIAGDEVLKGFAIELLKHIRMKSGDWVARYDGDEFLICIRNCDKDEAYRVAERVREAIEHLEIDTCAGSIRVTASFGVYSYTGEDMDMSKLLHLIDANLSDAKHTVVD